MARGRGRRALDWVVVLLVGVGATLALDLLAVPSAALFGGLVAGLGRALLGSTPLALPRPAGIGAQAVIGVSIGALIQADTLRTVAEHWLPVLLITVATLGVSLLAGQLMRLQPGISPVTGAFSMIAGGASGITAMARDLGADAQVVAVLQYLRVLLIVTAMPIVATTVYGASGSGVAAPADDGPGWPAGLLFTVVCLVVGVLLGRVSRLPVGALLGPLTVAAVLDVTGLSQGATVPPLVEAAGFLAIGLQVGLGFTRASLRLVRRALPLAVVLIVGAVAACAGLGVLLSRTAGVSALDGYLATTPGGLYAVLATATGSGADATFVLAVQVLRLFVMLFSAPLLARWLGRGQQPA
ncbi:AbrB family transcriptional regulator [Modestobacter sp. VKM Ac-2985]|uniref:AbrB family transcriptional regulator n=1 Tax=Modestobacter sp. VKM Ac-2985 TaxID=3004139 RepID=UPI0022AB7646|nr:AbrB family transcriptional regulator [Modestobacter sp. VKM Ac-2985]MCZ2836181.1 AbrB family transcriptional regulator [Modestobacter sp. VKM Ac-2985]